MNRLLWRALNSPLLVLMTAIAIAIQSSLFVPWPLRFFQPDIVLLVVIWCGLKRDFLEGGIITLIVAEMSELHTSAPAGVFLIAYMAVYLLLRAADKLFVLPTELPMIKVSMAASAVWNLFAMVVLVMVAGHQHFFHQMLGSLVPNAVMAAVFGAWVYRGLERFDLVTFKNVSAENPDEFQIDNIGI